MTRSDETTRKNRAALNLSDAEVAATGATIVPLEQQWSGLVPLSNMDRMRDRQSPDFCETCGLSSSRGQRRSRRDHCENDRQSRRTSPA